MKFWEKIKKYLFSKNQAVEFDISKDYNNFAGEDGDDDPDDDPDGPPPCPPPDPNCPPCPPCNGAGGPQRSIGKFAATSAPGIAKDAQFKQEFEEFKGFETKIVGQPFPGGSNVNVCPVPPNCAPGGSVTISQQGPQDCTFTVSAGGSGGNNPGGSVQCTFTY